MEIIKIKRPIGFTILALMLWWLTFAVIVYGFTHNDSLGTILPLSYAVTAFMSGLGLWKIRSWALSFFYAWILVDVLMMLVMQRGVYELPLPEFTGFALFTVLLLFLCAFYIKRTLSNIVDPACAQE
jgi:hypothetical protein